jgi:hypothetical protein
MNSFTLGSYFKYGWIVYIQISRVFPLASLSHCAESKIVYTRDPFEPNSQ